VGIYAKIGASSRAAAALFAVQHGLLPEEKIAITTTSSPQHRVPEDEANTS